MKETTCCFTGHRRLPESVRITVVQALSNIVDELIQSGVTDFISGGALGFDHAAAAMIISKKAAGHNLRLIFALPHREYDKLWPDERRSWMETLLCEADEVVYVSQEYFKGCMRKRNEYMVDRSAFCVYALLRGYSGTEQTVEYARRMGLRVISATDRNAVARNFISGA